MGIVIAGYPGKSQPKHTNSAPGTQVITPQVAIAEGQDYLINNPKLTDTHQLLVLDYLFRAYNIKDDFSAQKHPITIASKDGETRDELLALQRIAYPSQTVKTINTNSSPVTQAANCDHIPLPHNYSQLLQASFQQGGYEMTHVAFSIQIAKELGCHVIADEALRPQLRAGLTALVEDKKSPQDLRYEAIAFLGYLGYKDDIQKPWIDQIVSEQQADGNWISGNSNPTDHATVLALWALLVYTQPNTQQEPLIHRS